VGTKIHCLISDCGLAIADLTGRRGVNPQLAVRNKKETARCSLGWKKRAVFWKTLFLLFLAGLEGDLGRRSLGGALLELIHASGRIHEFLLARVEWMAHVADTHDDRGFGGTGLDHVATGAPDFRVRILRMNVSFHKRAQTIAGSA